MSTPVYNEYGEHEIEDRIAQITRGGVVASSLVVIAGVVMEFLRGGTPFAVSHAAATVTHGLGEIFGNVLRGIALGEPRAVIQAGIILLIGTPWVRVALTIVLYVRQRDWTYTVICVILLALMTAGLVFGAG